MAVTNEHLLEAFNNKFDKLRLEIKADLKARDKKIDANTSFRDNLSGKIAVGVIAIGAFISVVTAVITSYVNNKLFGK